VTDPKEIPWREQARTGAKISLITALAAWISYAVSSSFGLKEGFWAAISAVVVIQQDLAATRVSSRDRFVGTIIGGVLGYLCALIWQRHVFIYVLAVALSVLICWLFRISAAARMAAVTVTVIVLIPTSGALWQIALSRFSEVSWGIAAAVGVQALILRLGRHD
jgi:uncharacterized membrane protein YgaE (UPF0421/DUF939 family)